MNKQDTIQIFKTEDCEQYIHLTFNSQGEYAGGYSITKTKGIKNINVLYDNDVVEMVEDKSLLWPFCVSGFIEEDKCLTYDGKKCIAHALMLGDAVAGYTICRRRAFIFAGSELARVSPDELGVIMKSKV